MWKTGETEDVTYSISRNGVVVGMMLNINIPERNALHFYDGAGRILAQVEVPYLETGRFEPRGNVYLAQSARDGLRAFEGATGRELWSVPDVRLFAATDDARDVAAVGGSSVRIIRNGAVGASVPTGGLLIRRIAIAPDGSRIAIAGKHEIRVYDGSGTRLASISTGNEALSWTSVDVAAGGGWILAGVARDLGPAFGDDRRHPDGEVRAYDASGALVHSASLTFPIWNIWTPTVRFDRSGMAATITTRRAVYRTVLP